CVEPYAVSVVYGAVLGMVAGSRAMADHVSARYSSICESASVKAVEILLERLRRTIPALNEAAIARMPTFNITIAIRSSIKPKTLQIFSRQFATMIEAGLNVVSSLVILEEQTDDAYFASVIKELRADVEGGLLLSQALARHPKIFSRLYVAMVEAGEAAGILDTVLDRVAYQIEKDTQIRRRVKGAMMYPTMVLIFATLVLCGL